MLTTGWHEVNKARLSPKSSMLSLHKTRWFLGCSQAGPSTPLCKLSTIVENPLTFITKFLTGFLKVTKVIF